MSFHFEVELVSQIKGAEGRGAEGILIYSDPRDE